MAEGPAVAPEGFAAAFECSGPLAGAAHDPVLLTPAFSTAEESYGWNYRNQLPALGVPTCTLSLPGDGFGDLQTAAEYVVVAVRRMRREAGREVVLLAHQHGALDGLWAMTFWPDVARSVSHFVSLATPYNGTDAAADCTRCPPAVFQIGAGSAFLAALAAAPLPRGPTYTSIATRYDELITPQPEASRLDGARNRLVQDVCPGRPIEHFTILGDAVAYRQVLEAIGLGGPVGPEACTETLMPGADATAATSAASFLTRFVISLQAAAVPSEPATRPYAARTPPVLTVLKRRRRSVRVRCVTVGATACRVRGRRIPSGSARTLRVPARRRVVLSATDALGNRTRLVVRLRS